MARFDFMLRREVLRFMAEILLVMGIVSWAYLFFLEPALQSLAPDVYTQSGLDYGRYDFPDTPNELTHMTITVGFIVSFYYWRLHFTDLGAKIQELDDEL